jgi:DNA-binding MarR family transcriptional regulator
MPRPTPEAPRQGARPLDQSELKKFPGYLLTRARLVVFKAFENAVRQTCDLRPVEFSVLTLLATNDDVTQTQLSQALGVAPPNMTGILRRLEERELLGRARAQHDGRQQFLTLTAAGRRLVAQAEPQVMAAEMSWLARLSTGEQAMLGELLDKLAGRAGD